MVSLGKHPVYERHAGQFRNIDIHKTLTQTEFVILLSVLILHYLPPTLQTHNTRIAPPSPYSPYWVPWLRAGFEAISLLVVGSMRRIPQLRYAPMKMGTGFGMNEDVKRDKGKGAAEEANVLDRAGCPIIEFVFLVYVSQMSLFGRLELNYQVARILKTSMTQETLILDDLPHMAEEVRKSGYRFALNEKEGAIRLDDEDEADTAGPQKITSWQLVMSVWQGRAYVIISSMSCLMYAS